LEELEMIKKFRGKDFLTLMDFTADEISDIINVSYGLKMKLAMREPHEYLRGKTFAALFERPSTRTRNSFQVAAAHLGAQAIYIRPDELQLARGESLKDTARVLDRYYDGLFIRPASGTHQDRINEFAEYMRIPVINACSDFTHPCQGLADLLTILEKKGHFRGLKVAWSGDPWNVCHSLMVGCGLMGMDMYLAFPEGYNPHPKILAFATEAARANKTKLVVTRNLKEATEGADVVVANVFFSMAHDSEKEQRKKDFSKYQINDEAVAQAKSDYIFMHCGPAYPGVEVTPEIIEGPNSVYYDEAENRMHTEKAVLALFCS
jgi:ornithine carbamoyltransferase